MAKVSKTVFVVSDDLNGGETLEPDGFETVQWSVDGRFFEFDTTPESAAEFRDLVAKYQVRPVKSPKVRSRVPGKGKAASRDTKLIREWAQGKGMDVSDRGRIPQDIQDAYYAAN